jgi:hypothetical protein
MSVTNVGKFRDYIVRQYELAGGSAGEKTKALFAEDGSIQLADGSTVALEGIFRSAAILRRILRSERIMDVSAFREGGDRVSFTRTPASEARRRASSASWTVAPCDASTFRTR